MALEDAVWRCGSCGSENPNWHHHCPICGHDQSGQPAAGGYDPTRSYVTRPRPEPRHGLPTSSSVPSAVATSSRARLSPAPVAEDDRNIGPETTISPPPQELLVEVSSSRLALSEVPIPEDNSRPRARTWRSWRQDLAETTYAYLRHPVQLQVRIIAQHFFLDSILLATDGFLISAGHLEPPLTPGKTRLRWLSVCDLLYS